MGEGVRGWPVGAWVQHSVVLHDGTLAPFQHLLSWEDLSGGRALVAPSDDTALVACGVGGGGTCPYGVGEVWWEEWHVAEGLESWNRESPGCNVHVLV